MKPRYKAGKFPQYDNELSRQRAASEVLRWQPETRTPAARRGLMNLVAEYEGKWSPVREACSTWWVRPSRTLSVRPVARVSESRRSYRRICSEPSWKFKPGPTASRRRLPTSKVVDQAEVAVQAAAVLQYGPRGQGRLRDGILAEIDGQPCTQDTEGLFGLDCAKSPFHGMLVADYREHIVKVWGKAKNQLYHEANANMKI